MVIRHENMPENTGKSSIRQLLGHLSFFDRDTPVSVENVFQNCVYFHAFPLTLKSIVL